MTPNEPRNRPIEPRVLTTYEGEVYSHRVLWVAAKASRDRAEENSKGAFYFDMSAMLLARLTVEAYCNFLIDILSPEVFVREREEFGSDVEAKIAWISDKVGYTYERGNRPGQTIKSLSALRDRIVHARPQVYDGKIEHAAQEEAPFMQAGELQKRVTPENRRRGMADVERLCEELHVAALKAVETDPERIRRLEPCALAGTIQRQTSASTLQTN